MKKKKKKWVLSENKTCIGICGGWILSCFFVSDRAIDICFDAAHVFSAIHYIFIKVVVWWF